MEEALYHEMHDFEQRYWWFVAKHRIIMHLLGRFLPAAPGRSATVCDIGCGTGALLANLASCYQAIGIDSSPTALAFCRGRGLDVRRGQLPDQLPLEERSVDAVVLSDVLEHVPNDRGAVVAAVHALRPGGLLVCTVPAHPWMWTRRDDFHRHLRRYRKAAYRSLFVDLPLRELVLGFYGAAFFLPMALIRTASRLLNLDRAAPDLRMPSPLLNRLFTVAFETEKYLLPRLTLPFGASLISAHAKS